MVFNYLYIQSDVSVLLSKNKFAGFNKNTRDTLTGASTNNFIFQTKTEHKIEEMGFLQVSYLRHGLETYQIDN